LVAQSTEATRRAPKCKNREKRYYVCRRGTQSSANGYGTTPSNRLYVGSTRHALPLWYVLARREAASAAPPMAAASPPCAALERAAQSKAEPRGAAL